MRNITLISIVTMFIFLPLYGRAQQIRDVKIDSKSIDQGTTVRLEVNLSGQGRCGLKIGFGDGSSSDIRVEDASKPIAVSKAYSSGGTYKVEVTGKTIIRGLNTVSACDGSSSIEIAVGASSKEIENKQSRLTAQTAQQSSQSPSSGPQSVTVPIDQSQQNAVVQTSNASSTQSITRRLIGVWAYDCSSPADNNAFIEFKPVDGKLTMLASTFKDRKKSTLYIAEITRLLAVDQGRDLISFTADTTYDTTKERYSRLFTIDLKDDYFRIIELSDSRGKSVSGGLITSQNNQQTNRNLKCTSDQLALVEKQLNHSSIQKPDDIDFEKKIISDVLAKGEAFLKGANVKFGLFKKKDEMAGTEVIFAKSEQNSASGKAVVEVTCEPKSKDIDVKISVFDANPVGIQRIRGTEVRYIPVRLRRNDNLSSYDLKLDGWPQKYSNVFALTIGKGYKGYVGKVTEHCRFKDYDRADKQEVWQHMHINTNDNKRIFKNSCNQNIRDGNRSFFKPDCDDCRKDYDLVSGILIEIPTDKGGLIVKLPTQDPSIRQIVNACS